MDPCMADDDTRCLDGIGGGSRRSAGFTLFEVAISLLLVSFGVVSVLMIYPMGLRQVQVSRCRILAGTKALELIDLFSGIPQKSQLGDVEPPEPWEGNSYAYGNCRWDLEAVLANHTFGIMPVPRTIAQRIESDGDEIQRTLDEGAQLYYVQSSDNAGLDRRWRHGKPLNEANRLVFAVVGYAQNNAVPRFPWKSWPYRVPFPSPPAYSYAGDVSLRASQTLVDQRPSLALGGRPTLQCLEWWFAGNQAHPDQVLPGQCDPAMAKLFTTFLDYGYDGTSAVPYKPPSVDKRKAYIEAAMAYARSPFTDGRIRFPLSTGQTSAEEYATYYAPTGSIAEGVLDERGRTYDRAFAGLCAQAETEGRRPEKDASQRMRMRVDIAIRVQCMRFLAHALGTLSKDGRVRSLEDQGTTEVLRDATLCGELRITPDLIRYVYERSQAMVMRYAAGFPYDWGVPRPIQRCLMTDHPLIEWDLFSPPRTGLIAGATPAAMWRPIAAQPITNLGPATYFPGSFKGGTYRKDQPVYPNWDDPDQAAFWGDPGHFTLTKRFATAERCRQIVFWTVDWQQYEDAETAPSAPVDASRHPLRAPSNDKADYRDLATRIKGNNTQWRMVGSDVMTHNPELNFLFCEEMTGRSTGQDVTEVLLGAKSTRDLMASRIMPPEDQVDPIFSGLHGADRNANRRIDRGPLSGGVHLRATFVSRYNYYDPRLPVSMR